MSQAKTARERLHHVQLPNKEIRASYGYFATRITERGKDQDQGQNGHKMQHADATLNRHHTISPTSLAMQPMQREAGTEQLVRPPMTLQVHTYTYCHVVEWTLVSERVGTRGETCPWLRRPSLLNTSPCPDAFSRTIGNM